MLIHAPQITGDFGGDVTLVTICLDESGSMDVVRDATIAGLNDYIYGLKTLPGVVLVTLITFRCGQVMKRYVRVPAAQVAPLSRETYCPVGGTPLYDSIMAAIAEADHSRLLYPKAKTILIVQTDGQENSSRQFKKKDVKGAISFRSELGWQFSFMGCGIDAYSEAASIGIGAAATMTYSPVRTQQAFHAQANATRMFASGVVSNYALDPNDKRDAGDVV